MTVHDARHNRAMTVPKHDDPSLPIGKRGGSTGGLPNGVPVASGRQKAVPDWLTIWLAAGIGAGIMVGLALLWTARSPEIMQGDIAAHASYAEWMKTLPWWDWRGWSDWFYGGHPIGVNYPPLIHLIARFTHPVWSQLILISLAMLCLLPWSLLRLARSVGLDRGAQLAAMALMLVVAPASLFLGEIIHGLHLSASYFGLGPSMMCICLGMFAASDAAACRRPLLAGLLLGLGALFNVSPTPGVLVLVISMLASSGATWKQAVRWLSATASTSIAVSAWWMVPFLAGSQRIQNWTVTLPEHFSYLYPIPIVLLIMLIIVTVDTAHRGPPGVRRLAKAAGLCSLTVIAIDLLGFQYSERSLMPAFLALLTAAGWPLAAFCSNRRRQVRPSTTLLVSAVAVSAAVISHRIEFIPAVVWILKGAPKTLRWLSALVGVTALLLSVPVLSALRHDVDVSDSLETQAVSLTGNESGFLMFNMVDYPRSGGCPVFFLSVPTIYTDGRVRHLIGGQQETSSSAEFIRHYDPDITSQGTGSRRPHWAAALNAKGDHRIDPIRTASLLGARWLAQCDPDVSLVDLPARRASGERVRLLGSDNGWHRAAVRWWIDVTAQGAAIDVGAVPVLAKSAVPPAYPADQVAQGVTLQEEQDRLIVTAASPGWAWLRVPWDPWWTASTGTPVLKGGPGHLIVWADQDSTELVWDVPVEVDAAAAGLTVAAAAMSAALAALNRRRRFPITANRPTPAAEAMGAFYDTVDDWAATASSRLKRLFGAVDDSTDGSSTTMSAQPHQESRDHDA